MSNGVPKPQLTPLQLFKNQSDENHLNILLLPREMGERCVCDLSGGLDGQQPKTSRHLAMLRKSGVLLDSRAGKWIYYRLSPHMPAWAAAIIEQAYLSQKEKIALLAHRVARSNATTDGNAACR